MKNLVEFLLESKQDEAKLLFHSEPVELNKKMSAKEIAVFKANDIYVDLYTENNTNMCIFYCISQKGVQELVEWLYKYEQTEDISELGDMHPGIENALKGKADKLYCVIDDIDLTDEFNDTSKFFKAGVEVATVPGKQTKYSCTFMAKTKAGAKSVILPWLMKYFDESKEDIISKYPELK